MAKRLITALAGVVCLMAQALGASAWAAPATLTGLGLQGRDAASGAPTSLVVLLHGYGSNGTDYQEMSARLSESLPDTAFFYPNAPTPQPTGGARPGFSWFEFSGGKAESSRAEARDWVLAQIGEMQSALAIEGPVVVAGFSQGGGVAVHVGSCAPEVIDLTISMGGVVDAFCPADDAQPEILMVHNAGDPRVPLDWGERARDALVAAGHAPHFEVYPGDRHWPVEAALADVEAAIIAAIETTGDAL